MIIMESFGIFIVLLMMQFPVINIVIGGSAFGWPGFFAGLIATVFLFVARA